MKKYKWVDVTNEGEGVNIYDSGVRHVCWNDWRLLPDGKVNRSAEIMRWKIDDRGVITVEKRIEVEPKPETVYIGVWADGAIRAEEHRLGSKTISYKSAVELGLIKE